MDSKNLKFNFKTKTGETVECIILCQVGVDDDEVNIVYKTSSDPDDTLRYGKVVHYNDSFILTYDVNEEEKEELMKEMNNEIIKMAETLTKEEGK